MLSARHREALRLAARFIAPYRWHVLGALLALLFAGDIALLLPTLRGGSFGQALVASLAAPYYNPW